MTPTGDGTHFLDKSLNPNDHVLDTVPAAPGRYEVDAVAAASVSREPRSESAVFSVNVAVIVVVVSVRGLSVQLAVSDHAPFDGAFL